MKIKLLLLICLGIVLIMVAVKSWIDFQKPDPDELYRIEVEKEKELANQGSLTPESRVANYLSSVRGKRGGILVKSMLPKLGDLKNPGIVEPLIRALTDKDVMVRTFAAYALGQTKDPRAFEPLLVILEKRKIKDYASVYAAEALGNFNNPRAVEPLISALSDTYYEIRGFAAFSLGQMKIEKAEPLLEKKLDDPHWFVRQWAALGLDAMQAPGRTPYLVKALKKETHANTQQNIIRVLGKTGDSTAVQPLLEVLTTSSDPTSRNGAAIAIADLKDPSAIVPLEEALNLEKDPDVKSWIKYALNKLKEIRDSGNSPVASSTE